MSLHEEIAQRLRKEINELVGQVDVSPTLVAIRCYDCFGSGDDDAHVRYGAIEHYKSMARGILAKKFEPEGDENNAHQGDMFSGQLQQSYPIHRAKGDEPIYRPLSALSLDDLNFNVQQLIKSADARVEHARALAAYRDMKNAAVAA